MDKAPESDGGLEIQGNRSSPVRPATRFLADATSRMEVVLTSVVLVMIAGAFALEWLQEPSTQLSLLIAALGTPVAIVVKRWMKARGSRAASVPPGH